jgi:UDP-N-acetylmuramoylalanine--D-glutamate ligase
VKIEWKSFNWETKTAAVLGLGVSNIPLIRFLLDKGCKVKAGDRKTAEQMEPEILVELKRLQVPVFLGRYYIEQATQGADIVFRSPSLRPDVEPLKKAVEAGALVSSEIEAVAGLSKAPVIGITGSEGKTTTTTIIGLIMEAAGRKVHVGGNIGTPLIQEVEGYSQDELVVLELSSFQLMTMTESPHISVVTNVTPNHLDIHTSMDEYVHAKGNICRYQGAEDLVVLNKDNKLTAAMGKETPGRVMWFSRQTEDADAFVRGEDLFLRLNGEPQLLMNRHDFLVGGWHNVENVLAAALAATAAGATLDDIRQAVRAFRGVEHRQEFVREINGVRYINDSIASSPTRTAAGLRALNNPMYLIVGGYDKHIPFDELGRQIAERVEGVAIIGATGDKLEAAIEAGMKASGRRVKTARLQNLAEAVQWCSSQAAPGSVVLLSPACASFDQFKNFEERGRLFKELVNAL